MVNSDNTHDRRSFSGFKNRILLIGFGILLILTLGATVALRYSLPQRIFARVRLKAPLVVSELGREVKFGLLPRTNVASPSGAAAPLQPVRANVASGPLRVSQVNPRYFTDSSGKAIYLTGSHTWSNFQDNGGSNPPAVFDYNAYLNFLQQNNHNFFRLWVWEQSRWTVETADNNYWFNPFPYQRTGPGNALDGQPKFDLTKFNQAYFDRLRQRVIAARDRGIYVSIMLFDGWSIEKNKGQFALNNPWHGHPFNINNNINGVNGDQNNNDSGEETQTLSNPPITALDEAYVRKVIDTVNDLDNVLYEISNESNNNSEAWQYHMINYIHQYEAGKPKQHPVGMTTPWPGGYNPDLFASPAEWISPNNGITDYLNDPPPADGSKVILADTDHLCGVCGNEAWVWKSFTRGENVIFMDAYDGAAYGVGAKGYNPNDPKWALARKNMGYTLSYANRMDLAAMRPLPNLASTGYILANPNGTKSQYLIYLPSGGSVNVDLSGASGSLKIEWLNPSNGNYFDSGGTTGGGNRTFTAPFSGDAVLYLYSAGAPTKNYYLPNIIGETPVTISSLRLLDKISLGGKNQSAITPSTADVVLDPPSPPLDPPVFLPGVIRGTPPPIINFTETFDGMPASPQPWSSPNFDVQVHSRDQNTWLKLETMQAAHNIACGPPPATHFDDGSYPNAVFQCHDHVMTALNAGGYGEIYLTPDSLVDFSQQEAVVRFDMSTLRSSFRDWVDLWVTPYDQNLALPIDTDVDLQGAPKDSVHIRMAVSDSGVFSGAVYRNFIALPMQQSSYRGYEAVLNPSAINRTTFELRIRQNHVKFGLPDYNLWWIDTYIDNLGWNRGILQLGHHSYNPTKDCKNSNLACLPNTWHWDNLSIEPALPFTMIKADRRFVINGDPNPVVVFNAPAPAGAFLRFSGIGTIDLSFDGRTFIHATKAQSSELPGIGNYHPEHLSNYWVSIPQGTQTVKLRFSDDDWYTTASFSMIAKDFAIWSFSNN